MDKIITYWPVIVAGICIVCTIINVVVAFCQKPTAEQMKQIKEWLLFIVTVAEREFGSGMGKIKLRYVYDKFIERFGYLSKLISFEKFSELVDSALEEMKHMLEQNKKVQEYVGIEESPKSEDPKTEEETISTSEKE